MWYQSHLKARVVQETFHTPHQHAINTPPSASIHDLGAMRRQRSDGSFKPRVPSFLGENDLDAYLAWEKEMELVFSYHHYTQEKKVRKAASTFIGHAINWWEETKFIRRYYGESQITSWSEMKAVMKKRFVSTYDGRDVHPKLRRMYQNSISADGYYQEMEPLSRKATRHEQQNHRSGAIRTQYAAASNPAYTRDGESLEAKEGNQTTKLIQGDKGKSSITPMIRKVESFKCQDEEPEKKPETEPVMTTPCQGELSANQLRQEEHVPEACYGHNHDPTKAKEEGKHDEAFVVHKESPETLIEQGGANYGIKGVNNILDQEVKSLQLSFISKELDLRSNPVKGGEDGVILESLNSRDKEPSIQQISTERERDIRPVNQAYLPNQKDLSYDSTCSRNLTHEGITEKKNRLKSSSHEEDMQLTSRRTCKEPEREQRLVNEVFRSNQDEPSCESTCFGNLTHQRCTASWIHFKINYGLKVIQLLNQEMPGLPYLQAHGFNHLQIRLWRPGEAYNHSGDTSSYDGHYGRAKTHLVHAASRDGRISPLPDRTELVRPPEQIHEVISVSMVSMHVSAHSQRRAKAQKAQEDIKDKLGPLMDEPNKMWVEQGPYWPMKLKDRPPWAKVRQGVMLGTPMWAKEGSKKSPIRGLKELV